MKRRDANHRPAMAGGLPLAGALIVGVFAATTAAMAQPYQALPVDEAGEVPAVAELRDALIEAVARRDTDAVVALADPNIALSFGMDSGRDTLRQWLDGGPDSPWTGAVYWRELERALALGGAWYRDVGAVAGDGDDELGYFCAPYTFFADYPLDFDLFTVVMVIREDAPLYDKPGRGHRVVAKLDHAIAEIIDNGNGYDPEHPEAPYWVKIRTADGVHEGFISSADFRSPVDYRACFEHDPQTGGVTWDAFIAGD